MRTFTIGVATLAACFAAAPSRAEVQLAIHDGRVSLTARDATVQQILAEWARVGQTRVVNLERVPGGPMTLQLIDVPEQQALEIVLRLVSGYLAAPRATFLTNASRFDRIIVMPTSAAARSTPVPTPAPSAQPRFTDDHADGAMPILVPPNAPPGVARTPVFSAFPTPESVPPPQPNTATTPPPVLAPTAMPTVPAGTAVPGVIMPMTPPPPAQPGPVSQPAEPNRP